MCSVYVVDVWVLSGQFKRDGVQATRNFDGVRGELSALRVCFRREGVLATRIFDGVGGELSALRVVLCLPRWVRTIVG